MDVYGGNLFWCAPYKVGKIVVVVCDGKCIGMTVDGDMVDRDKLPEGDDLDDLVSQSDTMDCRDCPFFDDCEAMDEEIG